MVRIEAVIKLLICSSLPSKSVPTGFRITLKIGDKAYYGQMFSFYGKAIPLGEETNVIIDIVYGELAIEEFLRHCTFEFVTWEKLGEGHTVDIIKVDIEQEALDKVDKKRKDEIISIVKNLRC